MWDVNTGDCLKVFTGHEHSANRIINFKPGCIASSSDDSTIKFWNIKEKKEMHKLTGHNSWIVYITVMNDGTLVSVGFDK